MIKKRLMGLMPYTKKYIAYNVLWQWIALLAQIAAVFFIADLLEKAAGQVLKSRDVFWAAVVFVLCIGVRYLCDRMAAEASCKASADVKRILRTRIYEKMLRMGAFYKGKVATSEVMQVSTEGVEQLEIYFGKYLPQMFYSLLAPVTLFAVLCGVSWKASLVLLLAVPLIPLSIVAVQKIAKRLLKKYWSTYTGLGDSFLENLQGLTTLKIYQADEEKAREMDQEAQQFRKITMKVLIMQLNSTSVMDLVAYGGAAAGMIVALWQFLSGDVGIAGALCIILLASEFFIPLRLLGSFFHIAMNGMAASDKIFAILDLEEPVRGKERIPGGMRKLELKLSQVSFSYEPERQILKEVSLSVPAGTFLALAGESGCGKSTIAGLLSGRIRGGKGAVEVNGIPVGEICEENLMRNIVLVRHNSYLWKGTVEENLRMAKADASREEMEAVLDRVQLLQFLREQEGLKTRLLEGGANFSGGQRQRLAMARALLADAPVYIFDEATSNIDVESEELIMQVIRELAEEKTVVLISHRLANVVNADQICMMSQGEIVESGTHEQLMQEGGMYSRLFGRQMELEHPEEWREEERAS